MSGHSLTLPRANYVEKLGHQSRHIAANLFGHFTNCTQLMDTPPKPQAETEPVLQREPSLPLPNPARYADFTGWDAHWPPQNGELYLALGDATISNWSFLTIRHTSGHWAWMEDEGLNMSLEALRRWKNCDDHHIDIVNTNVVQMLQSAAACEDADEAHYDFIRQRYDDKKWIFIPINNGMAGDPESISSGTHWSFVLVDRVHQTGLYYDSFKISVEQTSRIEKMGQTVLQGLLEILRVQNIRQTWIWSSQEHSPEQWKHNQASFDFGPCGPFVWKMCHDFINNIIEHQTADKENDCDFELEWDFPLKFKKNFNSIHVRENMFRIVAHYKTIWDSASYSQKHDQTAIEGEDVVLSEILPRMNTKTLWELAVQWRAERAMLAEQEQEQEAGVVLADEESSYIILGMSEDKAFGTSTSLSDPPKDILLDGSSDDHRLVAGASRFFQDSDPDSVLGDSPPRLPCQGARHSFEDEMIDPNLPWPTDIDTASGHTSYAEWKAHRTTPGSVDGIDERDIEGTTLLPRAQHAATPHSSRVRSAS